MVQNVLDMLAEASPSVSAPIVLFTYFNPIMARGLEKFCADVRAAGGSGLLVPDIPLEETAAIRAALNAEGLELVLLTTPTTGTHPSLRGFSLCLRVLYRFLAGVGLHSLPLHR